MAVQYTSGSIKIQGLGNGTDFGATIDQLEQIEMAHALKLDKWKNDWQTRLDAFDTISTTLTEYSAALKAINREETFLAKTINYSNENVLSATAKGNASNGTHTIDVKQLATNSYANMVFAVNNRTDSIYDGPGQGTFNFTLDGAAQSFTIPPNTTLEGLKNIINTKYGNPPAGGLGMKASIVQYSDKHMLQLYSTKTGENTIIDIQAAPAGLKVDTQWATANPGGWSYQNGTDALVNINGFPAGDYSKISSNTITSIEGLTINLLGTGKTTVTLGMDKEHIKESIDTFVQATNALRTLLLEYTQVDTTKSVIESDYAESQFETQQGGVLTGNYGVQLVMSKMKMSILSKPLGFAYRENDAYGNMISGDTFSSLSQLGIKTDDTQGSPTYGLLVYEDNIKYVLEGKTTLITLDEAIDMDPEGIAELFAAKNKAVIDSDNFGFVSMVDGQSKGGEYDVSYEVLANGELDPDTVYINGKKAKYYPGTNQIMALRGDGADNDADGILLNIFNNTPTTPGNPHTGKVRVKQGFLNDLTNMIDVDFLDPDNGDKDTRKGTIPILQSQYKNIIKNINEKIIREDERLILWRRRMEARFSILDTTLKNYEGLQSMLESQIASLSSTKKD